MALTDAAVITAIILDGDEAGEVVLQRLYVADGAPIHAGDPVCLVRTERLAYVLPAGDDGVAELLVEAGNHVPVGAPLVRIAPPPEPEPVTEVVRPWRRPITPLARSIAHFHGFDLDAIVKTTPDGRVRA